jgi:rhodanese-related sulfurtransferase
LNYLNPDKYMLVPRHRVFPAGLGRRLIAIIGALLLALSGSISAAGIEEVSHGLGEILPHRKITGKMQWTNKRDTACEILAIEPGCDCVAIRNFPKSLEANQSGQIDFEIIGRKPGRFDIDVQVKYVTKGGELPGVELVMLQGTVADLADRFLVSREDLSGDAVFIDVRNTMEFRVCQIPKSLNLPIHLIQTRRDLKMRELVLVHDGVNDRECLDRCLDLKDKGFRSVRVLEGGIRKWQLSGGPTESSRSITDGDWQVPPSRIPLFSQSDGGLIVYLAREKESLEVPDLEIVSLKQTKKFGELVAALVKASEETTSRKILVISSDGGKYVEIEKELKKAKLPATFYLRGGRLALEEWQSTRTAAVQTFTMSSSETVRSGLRVPIAGRLPCNSCPK